MSQINNALGMISSPNYNLNQILQATQPAKQPGKFRQFLGAAVGAVGNMFAPGIGGMIGSAIYGGIGGGIGGIGGGGLMGDTDGYLQLQQQMDAQTEAFQTASSVMKARHDAAMAAIRNIS